MAFDEGLAERIRALTQSEPGTTRELGKWVTIGTTYERSLPAKR